MKKITFLFTVLLYTFTTTNTPPTFTSTAITTVDEGDTYTYNITTDDVDGDNVTLTAPTKPSWLSLTTTPGGVVTTFAGSGSSGSTDGNGSTASFNQPYGVAVDDSGNVYVTDEFNHSIRKIAPNGDVSTFAGTGSAGSTDGNGTSASFKFPNGVAVDGSGNVYVADRGNHSIRKIAPNGDVTTLAGSGSQGSTDGNGTSASFNSPYGVAVDASGNVYVADTANHKIRKIAPNGDVTTVAGTGGAGSIDGNGTSASFFNPFGVAVDSSGNVYVADTGNIKIRKIAPNGDVTTLAGSGSQGSTDANGSAASFWNPLGVVVDGSDNVYVADTWNHSIRKIAPNGDVTTFVGSGSQGDTDGNGTSATFNKIAGVAIDGSENLYVADQNNHKIRKISLPSATLTGNSTGQAGDHAIVLEANDGNGGTVQQSFTISVNTQPTVSSSAANSITGTGATLNGNASSDGGATITERGFVYALSSDDSTPTVGEANGTTVVKVVVSGTTGAFNEAITGLTANSTYSFVAYAINSVGTTESSVATFTTINTSPTFTSTAITAVDQGDTYTYTIATNDADGDNVTITAPTKPSWLSLIRNITGGNVTTFAGTGSAGSTDANGTSASFNNPSGVAVDGSGNVYVADTHNHIIRKITPNGNVTTFAGTGSAGSTDANGTSASFNFPNGVALDGSGNLYVADGENNKIRKIAPNGDVTTLAGSGSQGDTDGNGASASFKTPFGVAVDGSGNVYVADANNRKIRKIAPNGDVTTVAGSGTAGNIDGNGTSASFNIPFGIALDGSGNAYVADGFGNTIRKIAPNGDVTTIAGSVSFSNPFGIVVDDSGNVYVSETTSNKIRKITPNGDVTTLAGSGSQGSMDGNGASASFYSPAGIALDATGNFYVADRSNNKIRKIITIASSTLTGDSTGEAGDHSVVLEANDDNGGTVQQSFTISVNTKPTVSSSTATSIIGTGATLNGNASSDGGATITERGFVYALSSDDSTPTVAEANGTTVVKVVVSGTTGVFNEAITGLTVNGTYSFIAYAINSVGTTESSVTTFTTINTAPTFTSTAITAVDEGDTYTYTITTNDVDGDNVTPTAPTKPAWLSLTINPGGDVTTFAGSGSSGSTDGNGTSASFNFPYGAAVDGSGNVYVADESNHSIRKIAPNGDVTTIAGTGTSGSADGNGTSASFNSPTKVAVDGSGNVYVADLVNHSIRKIAPNGDVTTIAGTGTSGSADGNGTSASFSFPYGVAVDASGNVYVADVGNQKIRKIALNGDVTTLAGSGIAGSTDGNGSAASFNAPFALAVDDTGNVYVADANNHSIRKIAPNGDVTTVAGTGSAGSTDGNGTSASFNNPSGVAVDASGNVYVADASNHSIRKIAPNGDVTTIAGTGSSGNTDGNGTSASFSVPIGVAVDGSGNIYVVDRFNHKIRKISTIASTTLTGDSTGQAGDHSVVLEANDGNGGTVQQSFTINVLPEPTVTLSVDNSSINEATGTATLTATLSNTYGKNVEVTIGYSGTALNGTDYNSTASTMITINAGSLSANASTIITPINDTSPEGNETIIAEITGVTNGTENGDQTLEITLVDDDLIPAEITFEDIAKTYGDADFSLGATTNSTGTISYSIVAGGTGSASLSGTNNETVNVGNAGTVTIRATLPADGNYDSATKDITLTIAKAILVVTGNNMTTEYGDSFSIGFTYGAFKNGDDASVLDVEASVYIVGTFPYNAGTYPIRPQELSDNNYTPNYVDGTLTVNKATLTVTADDKSKTYGDANPSFTVSYSGFKNNEDASVLDTEPTASSTAVNTTNVGTSSITISGGSDNNYTFSNVDGTLTINERAITVTADDKLKERGTADPAFTYVLTSGNLVTGDAFTGDITREAGEDAGTYAITQGTLTAGSNYNLTFIEGTLTIEDTIAPDAPTITHISEYTCDGNVAMTSDNTLKISGTAERGSTVEVFIEAISIGTTITDDNGFFTFDHTGTTLADGTYSITTQATDISANTGGLSAAFTITINTVDSDSDGIADFCDDDDDGNGVIDTEEDCDGDGIIDSQDTDNSACTSGILQTRSYGFSPNGDGINESWTIENITAFPNNTVSVYSRSGKLVFKKKGYRNDWTGVSNQTSSGGNNRKLPVGPYIFVIELGDGSKPLRGWLYINY